MVRQTELSPALDQDPVVCRCLRVRESEIANAISLCGASTVRDVKELTGAGGGCNCCHRKIKDLISGCGSCPLRRAMQVEKTEVTLRTEMTIQVVAE
jgi:NAD(P)H-nitrite reductase large subunit